MREIKFRAWHPEDKVMIYDLNTPKLYHGVLGSYPTKEEDDYIFMQYTGLKDKNGKEIYESDVMQLNNENYIVDWDEERASFTCGSLLFGKNEFGSIVIGNIYENPELMEGEE